MSDRRPALPELPLAEYRALKAAVTPQFLEAIRPFDLTGLPKNAGFALRWVGRKGFSLSSQSAISEAVAAVCLLGVYGQAERTAEAASVITRFPFETHRFPEDHSLAGIVRCAYYFARRDGVALAAVLEPAALASVDYRPHERVLQGALLKPYLDEPFPYGEHRDAYPRWQDVANYIHSIREFIYLWSFGGSSLWPRPRLEAEILRYTAAIHREPGFAPGV